MLTPQQTEILLANIEDFILTRGFFYSQKTYEGLEEFANNLEETIIGKGLIPNQDWARWQVEFPQIEKKEQEYLRRLGDKAALQQAERRYVEEVIFPQVEKLLATNLASLSPEELLKTRHAWVQLHSQVVDNCHVTTSNWYRVVAFRPMEKRFDEFIRQLDRLINSYYSKQWLGLYQGEQLRDESQVSNASPEKDWGKTQEVSSPEPTKGKSIASLEIAIGGIILCFSLVGITLYKIKRIK